jgi:outer membrane autotransporter protein
LVPSEKTYINGIASYGHNRYTTQRITSAGDTASGSTQGNQYALSVSGGYNFTKEAFIFNPYGRFDFIIATIDAFSESGGTGPLQVSSQRITSTVFSLGGAASYTFPLSWATLIPTARLEFQQQTSNTPSGVTAGLVGDPLNTTFAVPYVGNDKSYGNFGVGVLAVFKKGISATFNYEQLFGKENYSSQRYLLGLRVDLP